MTNDWMKRGANIGSHEYIRAQQDTERVCVYRYRERDRKGQLEVNILLDSVLSNIHPKLAGYRIHHVSYSMVLVNVAESGMRTRPVIVMSSYNHAAEQLVLQSLSSVLGSRCRHHRLRRDHKGWSEMGCTQPRNWSMGCIAAWVAGNHSR